MQHPCPIVVDLLTGKLAVRREPIDGAQGNRTGRPVAGKPRQVPTCVPLINTSSRGLDRIHSSPISGIDRLRQIFLTSRLGISVCRGIASTAPVRGLVHNEWEFPSRLR